MCSELEMLTHISSADFIRRRRPHSRGLGEPARLRSEVPIYASCFSVLSSLFLSVSVFAIAFLLMERDVDCSICDGEVCSKIFLGMRSRVFLLSRLEL